MFTEDVYMFPHEKYPDKFSHNLSPSPQLCKEGPGLMPEEIKTILLQSTGLHGVI
jgi:hypothetical protein